MIGHVDINKDTKRETLCLILIYLRHLFHSKLVIINPFQLSNT